MDSRTRSDRAPLTIWSTVQDVDIRDSSIPLCSVAASRGRNSPTRQSEPMVNRNCANREISIPGLAKADNA